MKYPNPPRFTALAGLVLLAGLAVAPDPARAGDSGKPTVSDLTIKIEGESTLHAWEVSSASADLNADVGSSGGLADALAHHGLKRLDLALSVASLKSTEGTGMDKNMDAALESDKFPKIQFHMKSYSMDGGTVTAQGDLSIHGQSKAVTLTGLVTEKGNKVAVKGVYTLDMSDYGIKPPVMMFGTIKTADPVKIFFGFKLAE
ncbi:MAG TPA: YceI family protein [bacterium]|nr:YceI family protein [bacterium]